MYRIFGKGMVSEGFTVVSQLLMLVIFVDTCYQHMLYDSIPFSLFLYIDTLLTLDVFCVLSIFLVNSDSC